jgi:hypothetical protein
MTPNQETLQDLLRRVESAERANKALDCDLYVALGLWRPPTDAVRHGDDRWRRGGVNYYCQHAEVTGSLDNALALVERCGLDVQQAVNEAAGDTYHWVESVADYRQRLIFAVLAALLRALIAEQAAHERGSEVGSASAHPRRSGHQCPNTNGTPSPKHQENAGE